MADTVRPNPSDRVIEQSNAWHTRALHRIPAGTQTLAKGAGQFVRGVAPTFLRRGKGARVWDVEGNEYLDRAWPSVRCRSATPTRTWTPRSASSSRTA